MIIRGLTKTTLLDYPGLVACTIFTGSCNMHCLYCHNSQLITTSKTSDIIPEDDIFSFLKKRKRILKGVCITGGEPTLNKDLASFIDKIRQLGFFVKLDTNGLNPALIQELISNNLINMIAMDVKGPKYKYPAIAGISPDLVDKIDETIQLIINSSINYEFRTTIASGILDAQDMASIGMWIKNAKAYYLQAFKYSDFVPDKSLVTPSKNELTSLLDAVYKYVPSVKLRGID